MSNKSNLLILIIIYSLFAVISLNQNKMKIDEYYNHYPTVKNINTTGLVAITDTNKYLAANTPLPYLISLVPLQIFNLRLSIEYLRLVNIIISFITIAIIYFLFIKVNSLYPLEKTLILFFYPYFLKTSFTYYMSILGLLFYFLFLTYDQDEIKNYLISGLLIAFSILSQQFYLALFFGLILILFLKSRYGYTTIEDIIFFALPTILLFLPLVYLWKGVVPANYSFHSVGIDLSKFTAILISIGLVALPFNFYYFHKVKIKSLINKKHIWLLFAFLILSFILSIFFYPTFAEKGGYSKITGLTFHFINIFDHLNNLSGLFIKLILIFSGLLNLYHIFSPNGISSEKTSFIIELKTIFFENKLKGILRISILSFSFGFVFNVLLAERHLIPLVLSLIFYNLIDLNNPKIIRFLLLIYIIIGSIYFYQYLFIQQSYLLGNQ